MAKPISYAQIQQAVNGSEQALAAILAAFLPFIRSEAARVVCPGLEQEDAEQECLIGLFRAVQGFRPGQSASFETYARRCIANAAQDARKAAGRKKHLPLNLSVPLEETPGLEQPVSGSDPAEITIQNEEYSIAMHRIHTRLSGFEKEVLLLFLDGYSYGAIAQKLGRPAMAVENAMNRVRRKLKAGR